MSVKLYKSKENRAAFMNNLVIPFAFDAAEAYEDLIRGLTQKQEWALTQFTSKENELFGHIKSYTAAKSEDLNRANAVMLEMTKKHAARIASKRIVYNCDNPLSTLGIKTVKLFLSKSYIGFLILEMDCAEFTLLSEVVEANDVLKSLKKGAALSELIKVDDFDYDTLKSKMIDSIQSEADTDIQREKKDYCKIFEWEEQNEYKIRYILKNELGQPYDRICMKRREPGRYWSTRDFDYKRFICDCLQGITVTTYFNEYFSNSQACNMPLKANVFTAPIIDRQNESREEILDLFFRLRKAYKMTYQPSAMEKDVTNNPEISQPFDDSYWGISKEGVANLTYSTNKFYLSSYDANLKSYFYIYLLALHQYYGLLYLAGELAQLPNSIDQLLKGKQYEKLMEAREKINFFFLKNVFFDVSYITHQSVIYKKMIENLGVQVMLEELQYEVERISGIATQIADEKRREEEKQRLAVEAENSKREAKRFNFLTITISAVAASFCLPGIIVASWDILNRVNDGNIPLYNTQVSFLSILLPSLFVAIPITGSIVFALKLNSTDRMTRKAEESKKGSDFGIGPGQKLQGPEIQLER